jgi:hypothetical protein
MLPGVKDGLSLIKKPLVERRAEWEDAKNNVEKMRGFIQNYLIEPCRGFQTNFGQGDFPDEYGPLEPYIRTLEDCLKMSTESDQAKQEFLRKTSECLLKLRSAVERLERMQKTEVRGL